MRTNALRIFSVCFYSIPTKQSKVFANFQTRSFFTVPTFSKTIRFHDKAIVACPPESIYKLVADVDSYHFFVPNVIESRVLRRPNDRQMEARLAFGIPGMISANYTSNIQLVPYRRIIVRSQPNDFAKYIESEWRFEARPNERTLVDFRVEFELYSHLTAKLLNAVLDDFTRKTMSAFLERAERLHKSKSTKN